MDTPDSPFLPQSLRIPEMTTIHEFGHQWFYGLVGSDEMNEAWLDEGVISYAQLQYLESRYGRDGNLTSWPRGWRWMPQAVRLWLALVPLPPIFQL